MNRLIMVLGVAALLLAGCGSRAIARPAKTSDDPLPHSVKGYELYSWPAGNDWCFVLVTGTNRLKAYQELTATDNAVAGDWVKITATGVEALKVVLGRLPRGEAVMWIGEGWLAHVGGARGNLALPDQRTIEEIRAHCQQLGVDLHVAD